MNADHVPLREMMEKALRRHEAGLTPSMRRVAQYLVANPGVVMTGSALDLAQAIGSSDASVIRTVKALGFSGLPDLRSQLGRLLNMKRNSGVRIRGLLQQMPVDTIAAMSQIVERSRQALALQQEERRLERVGLAVSLLAGAKRIVIVGQGSARSMGLFLADTLVRFGFQVLLVSGRGADLVDQMVQIADGDVIVMIVVGANYPEAEAFLSEMVERERPIVLVGNHSDWQADRRIGVHVDVGVVDEARLTPKVPFFMVLETLLIGLAHRQGPAVTRGLDEIDRLRMTFSKPPKVR